MKLDDRIKEYEKEYEKKVPTDFHIMIRIDGRKFSKFTKGFKKPFDFILSEAMRKTTIDLMREFSAITGYTQSDEITLLIPSLKDNTIDNREEESHKLDKRVKREWKHIYNGRVMKIASLISSYTSIRFNNYLMELLKEVPKNEENKDYIKIVSKKIGKAYFDARVFGVPEEDEVLNTFLFRTRDAEKNSKSIFAQAFVKHKELQNLNGNEQIKLCKEKTGEDWNQLPKRYKYGIFIKRDEVETDIPDEYKKFHNNRSKKVKRVKFSSFYFKLNYSKKNINFIMSKYTNAKTE